MKKKTIAILLASVMTLSSLTTVYASSPQAESSQSDTPAITIAEESPVDAVIDSLDKDSYGGIYYEGETLHIIPVPGCEEELARATSVLARGTAPVSVSIDPVAKTDTVYSMTQLEEAQSYLLENLQQLGIIAVGLNGMENALAVYLNDGDEETILAASPVKNILFRNGDVLKKVLPSR